MTNADKMKIAQVMASDGEGGLEKHFIELCNGLSESGHSVYALCLPKYKNRLNKTVHFVNVDLTKSRRNPLTLYRLYASLKKIAPDIIHAQANKAAQMVSPSLRHLNAKSVTTIHNIKSNLSFLTHFDLCVGVSRGVVNNFPKQVAGKVIYNGIRPPQVSNNFTEELPVGFKSPKPKLLSVGRLVAAKGFDLLIDACESIDCHLFIAGEGPDRETLQQQIKKRGLTDKVFLLGHRDDIPNLITASDLVVISSRKEGFSYVFAEALLLKKPVVSTNVPIPNEVLEEAYIADINSASLRAKLISALKNLHNKDFGPTFAYAEENLTLSCQINKTIEAYREILNKPS